MAGKSKQQKEVEVTLNKKGERAGAAFSVNDNSMAEQKQRFQTDLLEQTDP